MNGATQITTSIHTLTQNGRNATQHERRAKKGESSVGRPAVLLSEQHSNSPLLVFFFFFFFSFIPATLYPQEAGSQ